MLSLDLGIPIVYVPLRNLPTGSSPIESYIYATTLHHNDNLKKQLFSLSEQSSVDKPSMLLVLDGLNELDGAIKKEVLRETNDAWGNMRGIQVLISSRNNTAPGLRYKDQAIMRVQAESLSRETIKNFLEANNILPPKSSDRLWDIIDTPLMLVLYTRFEEFKKKYAQIDIEWRESKNPGAIIWNYLQSETYLRNQDSISDYTCCVAAEYFAPYICYQMNQSNQFIIDHAYFSKMIDAAYDLYESQASSNSLPKHIQEMKYQTGGGSVERDNIYKLLVNVLCLFHVSNDSVQLIHQHFRDCFAAIYLYNAAEASDNKSVPHEWYEEFDQYTLRFIADLLESEPKAKKTPNVWQKIWEVNRHNKNTDSVFTQKMLTLYRMAYGDHLESVNFGGLDLSNVLLTDFDLSDSKGAFIGTKLSMNSFWGKGHKMNVSAISWSPDNTHYLTVSYDCTIRIWNQSDDTNEILRECHRHYIRSAQWHPLKNNTFVSAGDDRTLFLWTYHAKRHTWVHQEKGQCSHWIRAVSWAPDGSGVLCGEENGNLRYFPNDGNYIDFSSVHHSRIVHIAWCEDSLNQLATADKDGYVCIWDIKDRTPINIINTRGRMINSLLWVDSGILAVATENQIFIVGWSKELSREKNLKIEDLTLLTDPIERDGITVIASQRGQNGNNYIAVFYQNSVEIFEGFRSDNKYRITSVCEEHLSAYSKQRVVSAAWNKNCTRLICGFRDGTVCNVSVDIKEEYREAVTSRLLGSKCPNTARCSSWSKDGRKLAVGYDDGIIRIWDALEFKCINLLIGHTDSVKSIAWSNDNIRIVSGSDDRSVRMWNTEQKAQKRACIGQCNAHKDSVNAVLWLKNDIVVSGSDDCSIVFWNKARDYTATLPVVHSKGIYSMSTSPDEHYLVTSGNDMKVVLWNIDDQEKVQSLESGHEEPVRTVLWTIDGKEIITTSNDGGIISHLFDQNTERIIPNAVRYPDKHGDFIYGAAISQNGKYLISGTTDSLVGIWDIKKRKRLSTKTEHSGFIWNVSASPEINSKYYAASASSDGNVIIWDVSDDSVVQDISIAALVAIPNINLLSCDLKDAIVDEKDLKRILWMNGGIIDD